jgi:hypothetical protein
MPAGGRGYTRPASLVSVWSTAPFFQNNSLGRFEWSPSVEARMRSFQDSIEKLLWPERRPKDPVLGDKVPGWIDRTEGRSNIRIAAGYLPDDLKPLLGSLNRYAPWLVGEGGIRIGPFTWHAGEPDRQRRPHAGWRRPGGPRGPRAKAASDPPRAGQALKKGGDSATDDELRKAFAPLVPSCSR